MKAAAMEEEKSVSALTVEAWLKLAEVWPAVAIHTNANHVVLSVMVARARNGRPVSVSEAFSLSEPNQARLWLEATRRRYMEPPQPGNETTPIVNWESGI